MLLSLIFLLIHSVSSPYKSKSKLFDFVSRQHLQYRTRSGSLKTLKVLEFRRKVMKFGFRSLKIVKNECDYTNKQTNKVKLRLMWC